MPPNVLFVLTDQLRAAAMGCAENPDVATPTLDRLASEGVRATDAQTTKPMCSPARASILTGQFPHRHRVVHNQLVLPTDGPSMGRAFRDNGYRTGYVGKWHLDHSLDADGPGRVPPGPRRQGFTDWSGFNDGHEYHRGHPEWDGDGDLRWREGYQPTVQTDVALDLLDRYAGSDAPFLLFLSWGPPHPPLDAPDAYRDRYDPDDLELRPNVPQDGISDRPGRPRRDASDVRADLAAYYGLITSLDDELARLVDRLDALGVAEDTILVFTSDHGEMLGSHGRYHKGAPFEEALNVPLIVRYPRAVPAGATSSAVLSLADLFPTLCSFCDVPVPDAVQGRDVADHLRGEAPGPDESYVEDWRVEDAVHDGEDWGPWGQPYRVLRTRRYSITVDHTLETRHLFDVAEDPYQQSNLAGDPEHADLEAELRERLSERARAVDDREFVTRFRYA